MSTFNVVTSNAALGLNDLNTLYTCPSDKSHALVDVNFLNITAGTSSFKMSVTSTPAISITEADELLSAPVDLFDQNENYVANKVVVGRNQSLYVKCTAGSVNVRVSGIEENNPVVQAAGKLAGVALPYNTVVNTYKTATPSTTVITMASLMINNKSGSSVTVAGYITNALSPSESDKFVNAVIDPGRHVMAANITLKPNETLFLKNLSNVSGVFAVVNGITQS